MRSFAGVALALVVAACGDNVASTPDADTTARCAPTPGPLPTEGQVIDPYALPLPASCVEGGLEDITGRWFLADPMQRFAFEYPKFEGNCTDGFRRAFSPDEDHNLEDDGTTFHMWSDGTRLFSRRAFVFETPPPESMKYEYVFADVACMLPDGSVAAVSATYDTDNGLETTAMTGKRFGRKDELAKGLTLVGELGTYGEEGFIPGYNVAVDGDHAYVVGPLGLDIIDVANPAAPVHVSHVDGYYNDVRIVRGNNKVVAFVSPIGNELTAYIDVTDPAAPTIAGELPEYSHSVQVATRNGRTYLYLATYSELVPEYDVTDPLTPMRVGAATIPGDPHGVHDLTVAGSRLYVNYTTGGLVALDFMNGIGTATELGRTQTSYSHASQVGTAGGRAIVLHGDEGMTGTPEGGSHLRILDGDPASATFLDDIGKYQTRPEVGIHNIELVGDKAYIAYYQDGVRVVDLSDPTMPREIAHYNTWDPETGYGSPFEGAIGIRVVDGLIYVADTRRGLLILDEP